MIPTQASILFLLFSSLFLGLLDLGFFMYTSITLYDLSYLRHSIHCSDFHNYSVYSSLVFLLSILVILSFLCFMRKKPGVPIFMILVNFFSNLGVGIYNFINKETLCDNECRSNCSNLNNYGDIFTIFMITNICCISIILIGTIVFLSRNC